MAEQVVSRGETVEPAYIMREDKVAVAWGVKSRWESWSWDPSSWGAYLGLYYTVFKVGLVICETGANLPRGAPGRPAACCPSSTGSLQLSAACCSLAPGHERALSTLFYTRIAVCLPCRRTGMRDTVVVVPSHFTSQRQTNTRRPDDCSSLRRMWDLILELSFELFLLVCIHFA